MTIHELAQLMPADARAMYARMLPGAQVAIRDAYDERMAFCTVDGGLTEEQAHRIAMTEVAYLLRSNARSSGSREAASA